MQSISICVRSTDELWQHYRHWLIYRIPSLRFLDFQKVRAVERHKAKSLFGTESSPSALASKIMGVKSRTFDVPSSATGRPAPEKIMRVRLTPTEKARVEKMIREAKSMQEITRLEKELNEGRIPAGAADSDRMEM